MSTSLNGPQRWLPALVAALLVASIAGSGVAHAREAAATPEGYDWSADASSLRGQDGQRFTFLCPADGELDRAWGTDVYTDDSSVCTAAVHAGLLQIANGGIVTIEIRPGQASYTGSTRNGVTSNDFGTWDGSFVVVSVGSGGASSGVKIGGGGWDATAAIHRRRNGSRYLYVCPPGGTLGSVSGTNVYTDDSSVCTAAVQVGVITAAGGGNATIEIRPGRSSYVGFTANGVTSRSSGPWAGSFVLAGAPPIPGSPGGGGGGGSTTTTTPSAGPIPPPTGTATGTVLVNGRPFTSGTIPFGTVVDVTQGALRLATAVGTVKVTGEGGLTAAFTLARGRDGTNAVVEIRLAKGAFSACPKRKKAGVERVEAKAVRQLWGDGKGRFRTRGRYAAATVRGTRWLTADRCDGTYVKVARGVVAVTDFPKRRQVTVRAGRSYLAKP